MTMNNSQMATERASRTRDTHSLFQQHAAYKKLLNFESRLDKDLGETTAQLVDHMKSHSLLSRENLPLMKPLEKALLASFDRMKAEDIAPNKNFFAMSLKAFFQGLSEDELELMCHNYVHNWINEHLSKSTRFYNKYQVEQKLEFIR